jgi:hypothetical protein
LKTHSFSNDKTAHSPSDGCDTIGIHFALSLLFVVFGVSIAMVERELKEFFFEYFKVVA